MESSAPALTDAAIFNCNNMVSETTEHGPEGSLEVKIKNTLPAVPSATEGL